jgi:hypothetical protein
MIRLWQFFIHGCWHKWELMESARLVSLGKDIGTRYVYQCERCKRIQTQDLT